MQRKNKRISITLSVASLILAAFIVVPGALQAIEDEGFPEAGTAEFEEMAEDFTEEELQSLQEEFEFMTMMGSEIDPEDVRLGEVAQCFDYYTFGSLKVDMTSDRGSYETADPVILRGQVSNDNPYPLTGVDILARIVKDIPNANNQADIQTIDEMVVAENLTFKAGQTKDIDASYMLSSQAPQGEYRVFFYVTQKQRFNLSGLSFTDDVIASSLGFQVTGAVGEGIYLDQTRTKVGGQEHINMGFVTQHSSDTPVEVEIPLINTSSETKTINVSYSVYKWDSLQEENLLEKREEEVQLAGNSEQVLSRTIEDASYPVYYLKIEASEGGRTEPMRNRTISNIRLAFQDQSETRLNFVGLSKYTPGQAATVVTCFHNTNEGVDSDITIQTRMSNDKGFDALVSEFQGDVPSAISAISSNIPARQISNNVTLTSSILDSQGRVIDTVSIDYKCNDIDPSLCQSEGGIRDVFQEQSLMLNIFVAGTLGVLLLKVVQWKKEIK